MRLTTCSLRETFKKREKAHLALGLRVWASTLSHVESKESLIKANEVARCIETVFFLCVI